MQFMHYMAVRNCMSGCCVQHADDLSAGMWRTEYDPRPRSGRLYGAMLPGNTRKSG